MPETSFPVNALLFVRPLKSSCSQCGLTEHLLCARSLQSQNLRCPDLQKFTVPLRGHIE